MPLIISGVDLICGGLPGGGVSGPSPPTIAPARDVLRRYTHASVSPFTLVVLICLSVL